MPSREPRGLTEPQTRGQPCRAGETRAVDRQGARVAPAPLNEGRM